MKEMFTTSGKVKGGTFSGTLLNFFTIRIFVSYEILFSSADTGGSIVRECRGIIPNCRGPPECSHIFAR